MEQLFGEYDQTAFNWFAGAHPHEAYDLDRKQFCEYCRSVNPGITDKEIDKLIIETR